MEGEVGTVVALIVVLSFAVDRIVSGVLFLLSFNAGWSRKFPDPTLLEPGSEHTAGERRYKLIYSLLAALLGILVLAGFGHVRVLSTLGVSPHEWPFETGKSVGNPLLLISFRLLDILVTGLILTAGADRVAHLMKWIGGKDELDLEGAEPKPIQITGKLTLEGSKEMILSSQPSADDELSSISSKNENG